MSLKTCNECHNEVSSKAGTCPHCGAPIKKNIGCLTLIGGIVCAIIIYSVISAIVHDDNPKQIKSANKSQESSILYKLLDGDKDKKKTTIRQLEEKVRKIPASKIKENLEGYQQLLKLDPDNPKYKKKIAHYKRKQKESKLNKSNIFIAKLDPKLNITNSWPCQIDLEEYDKTNIKLGVTYSEMPDSYETIKFHTNFVARKAIEVLTEQGRNPSEEQLFLSVWARKPEKGLTGKSLMRLFGRTMYNFNTDSLIWKPYKQ